MWAKYWFCDIIGITYNANTKEIGIDKSIMYEEEIVGRLKIFQEQLSQLQSDLERAVPSMTTVPVT